MKRFSAFLAWVSACCLVSFSPSAFSDPIPVETGPFSSSSVLTNLTFSSYEDFVSYSEHCFSQIDIILEACSSLDDALDGIHYVTLQIYRQADDIMGLEPSSGIARRAQIIIAWTDPNKINSETLNMHRYLRTATNDVESVRQNAYDIQDELNSVRSYNATYAVSSSDSEPSGGCQCPDYSSYLTSILEELQGLADDVADITAQLADMQETLDVISDEVSGISQMVDTIESDLQSVLSSLTTVIADLVIVSSKLTDVVNSLSTIRDAILSVADVVQLWATDWRNWFYHSYTNDIGAILYVLNAIYEKPSLSSYSLNRLNSILINTSSNVNSVDYTLEEVIRFIIEPFWGVGQNLTFPDFVWYATSLPLVTSGLAPRDWWPDMVEISDFSFAYLDALHGTMSNFWATVSPQSFQRNSGVYDSWVSRVSGSEHDLEPTAAQVAGEPALTAVIGLLYRIQHLLTYPLSSSPVTNSYERVDSEQEKQERQDSEEAIEEAQSQIEDVEIPQAPDDFLPFSDLFHSFDLLNSSLDALNRKIPDVVVSDHFIVVDRAGFYVDLAGNGTSLVGTEQTLHFTQGDRDLFVKLTGIFATLFGFIWYIIVAILGFLFAKWIFHIVVSGLSFAFSVMSGDLSSAVRLFERFGASVSGS